MGQQPSNSKQDATVLPKYNVAPPQAIQSTPTAKRAPRALASSSRTAAQKLHLEVPPVNLSERRPPFGAKMQAHKPPGVTMLDDVLDEQSGRRLTIKTLY
jgi:hypothetical protein